MPLFMMNNTVIHQFSIGRLQTGTGEALPGDWSHGLKFRVSLNADGYQNNHIYICWGQCNVSLCPYE